MCENDVVKISDFGTSRSIGDKSTKMTFVGTVAWMAPEVIRHELCSEKVDVWSYGVLLWELLTHEKPYHVSQLLLNSKFGGRGRVAWVAGVACVLAVKGGIQGFICEPKCTVLLAPLAPLQ